MKLLDLQPTRRIQRQFPKSDVAGLSLTLRSLSRTTNDFFFSYSGWVLPANSPPPLKLHKPLTQVLAPFF